MNAAQENQGAPILPANGALDVAVYLGKTAWVVPMVLVRQTQGQSELRQVVVAPEADDEYAARGKATMVALNAHPGFLLSTITCVRVAAVPQDS